MQYHKGITNNDHRLSYSFPCDCLPISKIREEHIGSSLRERKPESFYHEIEVDGKINVGDDKNYPTKSREVQSRRPVARVNGPLDKQHEVDPCDWRVRKHLVYLDIRLAVEKAIEPKCDEHGQTLRKCASHDGAIWCESALWGRCEHSAYKMALTSNVMRRLNFLFCDGYTHLSQGHTV